MERVVVHLWSELSSPRSLLGILNLQEAMTGRNVAVEHHAFFSSAPHPDEDAARNELAARGMPLTGSASRDTRAAQELIYAAKAGGSTPEEAAELGLKAALALHEAALVDGVDISSTADLLSVARRLGLNPDEVSAGLAEGRWTASVDGDVADAGRLGLEHAPHLLVAGMFSLAGPSTPADIARVLDMAAKQLSARVRAAEAEVRELF